MTLGLTSTGAVKIKTDGGLRAVNCACCKSNESKCYPTPFDPTGWVIISNETGNNIFNRDITVQMSYNGRKFSNNPSSVPFSKSSPPFPMTRNQVGDDCVEWQGTYGGGSSPDYWSAGAFLFRISGIFYFSYHAGEAEYEPNIWSDNPPSYINNFADSSSATILGGSISSFGFCSIPVIFGPHISNVTISFT
jgi:hypothetical protein